MPRSAIVELAEHQRQPDGQEGHIPGGQDERGGLARITPPQALQNLFGQAQMFNDIQHQDGIDIPREGIEIHAHGIGRDRSGANFPARPA